MKNLSHDSVLSEDTQRTYGKQAQTSNLQVAKDISRILGTTLGPCGMDKLLMDPYGNITVTNDGVTIMREMKMDHPVAKMIVEVAKQQEEAVADGTTTAVVLAGEFLRQAELLLDKGIHPTIIQKGFRMAEEHAQKALQDISIDFKLGDEALLLNIATTAMTGKGSEAKKEYLAQLVVSAIRKSLSNVISFPAKISEVITVTGVPGRNTNNSYLINGVILEKEKVLESMPSKIEGKVALFSCDLDLRKTDISSINLTETGQYRELIQNEEKEYQNLTEKLVHSGANILLTEKGINDFIANTLAQNGVVIIKRISRTDMAKLSQSLQTKINGNLSSEIIISEENALISELRQGENRFTLIQPLTENPIISLIVYGGTSHITQELKRATEDALGDLFATFRCGKVVAGAGSSELAIAERLRDFAQTVTGKEQFCIQAYADALESIPLALAGNAGLDAIDLLTRLRASHRKGNITTGINVFTGELMDAKVAGIMEPLDTKRYALSSATEVAVMILRIDDLLLGTPKSVQQGEEGLPKA